MGATSTSITSSELIQRIGGPNSPWIFDVRRAAAFAEAVEVIPTAEWRDHAAAGDWAGEVPPGIEAVVYCVHGHQVSQAAAALLRAGGVRARFLEGGIEGHKDAGGTMIRRGVLEERPAGQPSQWVTRTRPKIDRIASPWFIRRFVDRSAVIHFVEAKWVADAAVELQALPFDIPGVEFSHAGERCSFDAFLAKFAVTDPALQRMAEIIRGADTGRPELTPQSPGLLALALGLAASEADDQVLLEKGLGLYDALYAWCRFATEESHGWPPVDDSGVAA